MKMILYTLLLACLAAVAAGCDRESHLARAIEGCWEGPVTDISATEHHRSAPWVTRSGDLKCRPILTFVKDEGANGGECTIEAVYMFHGRRLSAVASGSWVAQGDDAVLVTVNPLSVSILSPAAIADMPYSDDILSADGKPLTYEEVIRRNILSIVKIYDIRIADGKMACEINDTDLRLRRKLSD